MEGMSDEEIAVAFQEFKEQQSRMEEDLPYREESVQRMRTAGAEPVLREIVNSGYERVAVVTHGGVIRSLAAGILEMPLAKWRLLGKNLKLQYHGAVLE